MGAMLNRVQTLGGVVGFAKINKHSGIIVNDYQIACSSRSENDGGLRLEASPWLTWSLCSNYSMV